MLIRSLSLEEGMKYTPIGISPETGTVFWKPENFKSMRLLEFSGCRPHMVGDLEKSSFSNIEQQSSGVREIHAGTPGWCDGSSPFRGYCFPRRKRRVIFAKFNVEGLLRGDYAQQDDRLRPPQGRTAGMSANDIRELEKHGPHPLPRKAEICTLSMAICSRLENAGAFAKYRS